MKAWLEDGLADRPAGPAAPPGANDGAATHQSSGPWGPMQVLSWPLELPSNVNDMIAHIGWQALECLHLVSWGILLIDEMEMQLGTH